MSKPILQLDNISKSYGDFIALQDVSLKIPQGAIYGFLGPNGAGKTTLIRIILSILKPSKGTISILGTSCARGVYQRIGYLPEEKGLYKKMKAAEIIAYFGTLKGLARKKARKRAYTILEEYGLKEFADVRCETLSKGMQQKVQILAAIVHEPEFMILDEPFSGLDPVNQGAMEKVIKNAKEKKSTVIFSTHIMEHAERLCDEFLLIAKGRKIFDGKIAEAKKLIPRHLRIETDSDPTALKEVAGVLQIKQVENSRAFEIYLSQQAEPDTILSACFEQNIHLLGFDRRDSSLRDVFIHLVDRAQTEKS